MADNQARRAQIIKKLNDNIPPIPENLEEIYLPRRVFWTQTELSNLPPDRWDIHEKIKVAISQANSFPLQEIVIQFWAAGVKKTNTNTTSSGFSKPLSICDQPHAITPLNRHLTKYRFDVVKYDYTLESDQCGPHVTAFHNHFPEVVLDLSTSVYKGFPLVDIALSCELTCSVFLPIFSHQNSTCVGVVECSMKRSKYLLIIFNELKYALQAVGLSIYHLQGSWPYKTINSGLKHATIEIEKALETVRESHDLTLAQVWIPYDETQNLHVPSYSSDNQVKRMFLVKLIGCCVDSDDDPLSCVKEFFDHCDVLPLQMGEGLAGKTLQTFQPHFCRNIRNLPNNRGLLAVLPANTKCSCFVMCLRSTHTGNDVDYVLEFFWPQSRDPSILLESLLSTLKRCLPSFKLPSGIQLGDQLQVLSLTESGFESFEIPNGTRLLVNTPEAPKETKAVKRKFSDFSKSQTGPNQPNQEIPTYTNTKTYPDSDDDDEDLAIVAYYNAEATLFLLPTSAPLATVIEKVKQDFRLDPAGTCNLRYEVSEGT